MSKMKKLLAVLACMAMVVAPGAALAEETKTTADGLEYEVYDNHVEIIGCDGDAVKLNIPAEIEGLPVTVIGENAFDECYSLASVNIPDSVTSIENWAFSGCYVLTSVNIPDSVTSIGDWAFYGCESLTSVNIPYGVTSIGDEAFARCTDLVSVNIPNGAVSIRESAFRSCYSLASVNIPDSVRSIGDQAFLNCSNLASINIPDSVTSIGTYAFNNTALYKDDSNWDNDVLYINNHLIEARKELSGTYSIRPGARTIADSAFSGCNSLTSVNIPDSVRSIGDWAFEDCKSLVSVNIPHGVESIGENAFRYCMSLASVNIPDSVTSIGDWAFGRCTSLASVNISDGVTNIGDSAFRYCHSLASVNIPDSVTSIGDQAFLNCSSLTDVYYGGSESDWEAISIGTNNARLLDANIHYNSTAQITVPNLNEIKVLVNGVTVAFDVPPLALDGTTMLPVRFALEPLGAEFVWDGESNTVTITAKGKTIVLTIGSDIAIVDGVEKTMLKPAMAMNGRTLIPIRFVAENLDYDVSWDGETMTVAINSR